MKNRVELLLGVGIFFLLFFLTIGYASYSKIVELNGNVTLKEPGIMQITSIEEHSSDLPEGSGGPKLVNGDITLEYSFTIEKASQNSENYTATYLVNVANNSPYDYVFTGFSLEPTITVNGEVSEQGGAVLTYEYTDLGVANQVNINETIPAGKPGVIVITIHFSIKSEIDNATIGVGGSANVNTSTDNSGSFYAGIVNSPVTLDLTDDTVPDCFNVDVTNTYSSKQSYYFSLTSNNFSLVDRNGNNLGYFDIEAPSENNEENVQNVELCIVENEGSVFASETVKTQVVINPTGLSNFSTGTITINVDVTDDVTYTGAPQINNVTFSTVKYDQTDSSLVTNTSWARIDTDSIDVEAWYIDLYSDAGTLITTFEISGEENISNYELKIPQSVLTGNTAFTEALGNSSNFYIKVYGKYPNIDSGGSRCEENTNYCVVSDSVSLKYQFTLTYSGNATMTNITDETNKTTTVYLNNSFTSVITSSSGYTLSGVTVTKGSGDTATTLTSGTHYSYALQENSSTVADFTILDDVIDNDITVAVSAYYSNWECLIKGTKIKVYGGYKNIEDIKYDDLLVAYSYELGKEVYEYPIKIEKEGKTNHYQRITFDDGSILNTFGSHGIFSIDANKFVSVLDRDNFDVGTSVLKLEDGNFKEVKVVGLEMIEEETTYYNITSTRYLNVIANGFLTTDPILAISNNFGFNEDFTWSDERDKYLATGDFIPYEMLKDYFPKYLYEGIRMGEAKNLINQGLINIEEYVAKFSQMQFVSIPTDKDGNNKWMITTSTDLENNSKGNYYTEGSFYKLPKSKEYAGKRFIGWYNTADNKYYQDGDLVQVNHGMYFDAVYEELYLFNNSLIKK